MHWPSQASVPGTVTNDQPRILVVDDDRVMLSLILGLLRHEGYHLLDKAVSGKEALERCRAAPPDIIFLDIEMPEMNGIETLEALQQQGVRAHVVLVSGSPTAQYVMAAREHRVAGFVVKPVSPKSITDAIDKCLKNVDPAGTRMHV